MTSTMKETGSSNASQEHFIIDTVDHSAAYEGYTVFSKISLTPEIAPQNLDKTESFDLLTHDSLMHTICENDGFILRNAE